MRHPLLCLCVYAYRHIYACVTTYICKNQRGVDTLSDLSYTCVYTYMCTNRSNRCKYAHIPVYSHTKMRSASFFIHVVDSSVYPYQSGGRICKCTRKHAYVHTKVGSTPSSIRNSDEDSGANDSDSRAIYVQVCCSVLQCVAVCYNVLQCVAQCVAVCCSVLRLKS